MIPNAAQPGGVSHLDPGILLQRAAPQSPWGPDHHVGVAVANGVAFALIVAGWWMASGVPQPSTEVAWLNVAIIGLVIAGGANGLWLARGYRSVTLARTVVIRGEFVAPAARVAPIRGANGETTLVTVKGTTRYHYPECLLVTDKEVRKSSRTTHELAGRRACEVCEP